MNPRLPFVIFVSFYFSVLLASYLLAAFNQFYTLYGWLLIPAVANFFVGYLVREADTATKIIIASFFLHAGIIIGLLNVPLVYNAFWFTLLTYHSGAYIASLFFVYYILNIPLGIGVLFIGGTVREYNGLLLERSTKIKVLFVVSMILSMGIVSTWISSDFYRIKGEPMVRWFGEDLSLVSSGFPLPYLYFTNSTSGVGNPLLLFWHDIQPFNHTNFLLDTLFYTSIYSIITAFGYTITHSKKTKKKLDEYLAIG